MANKKIQKANSLSPFRYPGSKRKLLPELMPKLLRLENISKQFLDVFVGGGSVALAVADMYPSTHIHLNDKDARIAAFWRMMSSDNVNKLIDRLDVEPTLNLFIETQTKRPDNDVDLAFQAIFLNRTAYSGILDSGPMGGIQQEGKYKINCRYNFNSLKGKILECHRLLVDRTVVTCEDFRSILSKHGDIATYLDPPYVEMGNVLYSAKMSLEDHRALATMLKKRDNWVLSYDNTDLIRSLYSSEDSSTIPTKYCISSTGKLSTELLMTSYSRYDNTSSTDT